MQFHSEAKAQAFHMTAADVNVINAPIWMGSGAFYPAEARKNEIFSPVGTALVTFVKLIVLAVAESAWLTR
jgi:hypothetical protein